ncbi:synaptotagmin-15 [Parasteatoda tepidariorum]|uniref:synaptotagmin-15 n=1 Tax=Parasteatoda tepidariorum TaxID=114398 RepID=UPI001C7196EC|nr:synaptotagmin-15 [Parasteatoda tepidariorum]
MFANDFQSMDAGYIPEVRKKENSSNFNLTENSSSGEIIIPQFMKYPNEKENPTYRMWSQLYTPEYLVAVLGISFLILMLAAGYSVYRRRKRRRSSYQPFLSLHSSVPKISKPTDPIVYNYVCTQKPVDFVVPSAPVTTLPSPVDPAVTANSIESAGALCTKLSQLEGGPTLLGGLNPEIYKSVPEEKSEEDNFPENHIGRLWFGVEYDVATERLIVRLVKAKNIPSRVYGAVNCCDPFVRIYLMPDERRYLQSRPKKKTCNPKFDETFLFQLPNRSISERTLKFTVFDNDRGKHHNPIGHVLLPLKEFFDSENHTQIQWRDLEKKETQVPCDLGEMMLSLCYNQNLERLIVTVCEAKSLRMPAGFKQLDTVARITFMRENKVVKTKKTMVCKNSCDPKYNESFHFKMSKNSINLCSITIQILQAGIKDKTRCLGRIVLGPYMFSRGKGLDHWEEAMAAGHKQIRYWHKLS